MDITKAEIEEILHAKAVEAIDELKIRKVVNRRGIIRKIKTAGTKGKKVVGGKVKVVSSKEMKPKRFGLIKNRQNLRSKSASLKKKATRFAVAGAKKRRSIGLK